MFAAFNSFKMGGGGSQIFCLTILFSFILSLNLSGQLPNPQILGPHTEDEGPYFIRTQFHYLENMNDPWIPGADLPTRTQSTLSYMNSIFNQYNIIFVPRGADYCTPQYRIAQQLGDMNYIDALNIYDSGDFGNMQGSASFVPDNALSIRGSDNGLSSSQSSVLIHEIGHCLGLSHTFMGTNGFGGGCDETAQGCPNGNPNGFCCGDYVDDTEYNPLTTTIGYTLDANCSNPSPSTLPEVYLNYMSYTTPKWCVNFFSEGQIKRMWAYLSLDQTKLDKIQVETYTDPTQPLPSISGNIVVESGVNMIINDDLEMLPGASIRVEKGGSLTVNAKISGACGKMWHGIIVEGNFFAPQNQSEQGYVRVNSGGIIEHAHVGIEVRDIDGFGEPVEFTGGGIVFVAGGTFKDNEIGIRYGGYAQVVNGLSLPNTAFVLHPKFTISDEYRSHITPIGIILNTVVDINISHPRFEDLRTDCGNFTSRASGIEANNAGFKVQNGHFENLTRGTYANQITLYNGAFSIKNTIFEECQLGIFSNSVSGFEISGNTFLMRAHDECPIMLPERVGTITDGHANGFMYFGNEFILDIQGDEEEKIGTLFRNTGEGLGNRVVGNTYRGISFGNLAEGNNAGTDDGLLYLCNKNEQSTGQVFPVSLQAADFRVESGASILNPQGIFDFDNQEWIPTGNTFSDFGFSFENLNGSDIEYYFWDDPINAIEHNPNTPSTGSFGIKDQPIDDNEPQCLSNDDPPCGECPSDDVVEWQTNIQNLKAEWETAKSDLETISNPAELEEKRTEIKNLRLRMNASGGRLITHYLQGSEGIQTNDLSYWLTYLQSYSTDVLLAKHHFFSKDLVAFQTIWDNILDNYDLTQYQSTEYSNLNNLFDLLSATNEDWSKLSSNTIDELYSFSMLCDEAGSLSRILLGMNTIEANSNCVEGYSRSQKEQTFPSSKLFKVFPNPTENLLSVELKEILDVVQVNIIDATGQVVFQNRYQNKDNIQLDLSSYQSGIYFISIRDTTGQLNATSFLKL